MATTAVPGLHEGAPVAAGTVPTGTGRRVARALRHDKGALLSITFLVLVILMAVFAPLITKITESGPDTLNPSAINANLGGEPLGSLGGISLAHPFGVEPSTGRDLLARVAYGARVSFLIAVSATLLTTVLGVVFGMLAGTRITRLPQTARPPRRAACGDYASPSWEGLGRRLRA